MDQPSANTREPVTMATAACKRCTRHEFTIAQISDLHFGATEASPGLSESVIAEVNSLEPDLVIVSGDLTMNGFKTEFLAAKACLDLLACPDVLVIPGNHDSMNGGYMHFADIIGPRRSTVSRRGALVVGVDSTQPDLHEGRVGRSQYTWIEEQLSPAAELRVVTLHHHLLPIPQTGREQNICLDAGDVMQLLLRHEVDIVLSGHKHVPFAWTLNGLTVVTAGTACSTRLRGVAEPCYNVIHSDGETVTVTCRPSQ